MQKRIWYNQDYQTQTHSSPKHRGQAIWLRLPASVSLEFWSSQISITYNCKYIADNTYYFYLHNHHQYFLILCENLLFTYLSFYVKLVGNNLLTYRQYRPRHSWIPTAAARVQSRVWWSEICGGQSGVGAGFLRVLWFPLPFIPPNSPSSESPRAGTIGQWVADVPSGPSLDSTPPLCKLK
jgi:hypothetical protein